MALRLIALEDGPDIQVDRPMMIVGRHPQCDARLDSIRVSRRHCCMTPDGAELVVRDLGSTNGVRVNGQRVEEGRVRIGDELSIAHIRFRLDDGMAEERTVAASVIRGAPGAVNVGDRDLLKAAYPSVETPPKPVSTDDEPLDDLPIAIAEESDDSSDRSPDHLQVRVYSRRQQGAASFVPAGHPSFAAEPCPHDSRH